MKFADLHNLTEDRRIDMIGQTAATGKIVGVLLEKDEPDKIARYIRKLRERYPTVILLSQVDGPTPLVVTLKFGPKPS